MFFPNIEDEGSKLTPNWNPNFQNLLEESRQKIALESKVERKREDIRSKVPPQWLLSLHSIQEGLQLKGTVGQWFEAQQLNDRERWIAHISLQELYKAMEVNTVSAREVTTVFGRRTAIASQMVSYPYIGKQSSNIDSPNVCSIYV